MARLKFERPLDDSIFQRVKRHHGEPTTGFQHALSTRERQMEFVELVVDEDSQSLERPRGRVDIARPGAHDFCNDISKRPRAGNRVVFARSGDGAVHILWTGLRDGRDREPGGRIEDVPRAALGLAPHPVHEQLARGCLDFFSYR